MTDPRDDTEELIRATRRWLEMAVIGLKLCPFAHSVYVSDRVRFRVSNQRSPDALLEDLCSELRFLHERDPQECETTLLIHPHVLTDFADYNDFLEICDAAVSDLGLEGEIQIASFHPEYRFAGTQAQDIENCTNRSPYPMLHLLREASIERAVAGFPDTDAIYRNNVQTMHSLGIEGWQRLWREFTRRG